MHGLCFAATYHASIRSWIQTENPLFGFLLETRVREGNYQKCMELAMPSWNSITNYGYHQLATGEQFIYSAIYAFSTAAKMTHLWSEIRETQAVYAHLRLPWILIGDYNVTLSSSEHSRNNEEFIPSIRDSWKSSACLHHSRTALSDFHMKLKLLKPILRVINHLHYGDITNRTKQAFEKLCECQNRVLVYSSSENFAQVAEASDKWNTCFFHRSVQIRDARNSIRRLLTEQWEVLTTSGDVKREAVAHFQRFLQAQEQMEEISVASLQDLFTFRLPGAQHGRDVVLWKVGDDDYQDNFSSAKTWEQICLRKEPVRWSKVVWMCSWGMIQGCMLCGEVDETRDHLFFACPYSFTVWHGLANHIIGSHTDPDWQLTLDYMEEL
ncbi:hypothetical protein DY000_02006739 [Brassica cretica]|uniref:Reverse transcriptase zinc-binding domain-containing protein n=1 Tax=Brassica cretica TaxID=69181 RepID=A0ABQ7BZ14_BRACR|nr:hypothetical protein DY000_02006739 [Brassica cretica]